MEVLRLPEFKGPENFEIVDQEESKEERKGIFGENLSETNEIPNKRLFKIEKNDSVEIGMIC